ncbi:MAG: glutathione S-transferase family protein [Pseudomonadota bacterium]|nr:glutathione S-transferase family protein [Pseudomonadota bacterium]
MITIWGGATSRTLRAHWACEELELTYTPKLIGSRTGATQSEAFRRLNPKEKIPVLIDDELVLSESAAIVTYLADTYGRGVLAPLPFTRERALYNQWLSFIQMELDAHTLYVMRKHRDLANLYGDAPAAIETAIEGFNKQVGVVTAHLRDQIYLLGDHFTGADILLTSVLTWAANYGFTLDPVLQRYMEKQTARSAYKRAAKLNFSISPGG